MIEPRITGAEGYRVTTVEEPTYASPKSRADRRLSAPVVLRRYATPLSYLLVIAIQLVVVWPVAMNRALDGDEGFYAMSAKLVSHGQEPYFDFWFQHAPLLPYIYGAWTRLTGETFYNLRALSALLTVGTGLMLFRHVMQRYSRRLGIVAVVLFITSALVFGWYSTFKSYALSTFLLFAAFMLVAQVDREAECGPLRWFAAGACLGLSVDVRLFFIALAPVFAFYAMRPGLARSLKVGKIPVFAVGLVIGLLPCIYFFTRDPRRFLDDTLGSQLGRTDLALGDSIVQKLRTLTELLGGAQFLILIAGVVILAILLVATHQRLPLAVAIAAALALTSILPSPVYDQYFAPLMPFLVIGAIECWAVIRDALPRAPDRRLRLVVQCAAITGVLAYVVGGIRAFDASLNSADFSFHPRDVAAVARVIDSDTREGEVVLAFSPGHLYLTRAKPLPGMESNFATRVVGEMHMSDARARRYKMLPVARLEAIVRSGNVRIVALGRQDEFLFARPWARILGESSYEPIITVGDVTIYEHDAP